MLNSVRHVQPFDSPRSPTIDISACKKDPVGTMNALLRFWPMSHSIRELVRMRALAEWGHLELPLLDVGCGNGLFWEAIVKSLGEGADLSGIFGVDFDPAEIAVASARLNPRGIHLRVADITSTIDMPNLISMQEKFQTVFANCSLEHVPNLDQALRNIRKFLHEDGRFLLIVPAPRWTDTLSVKRFLKQISRRLAASYGGALDGFFQHFHLYPSYVWRYLLESCGFRDIQIIGVGNATSNHLYEKWLPTASMGFFSRCLLGRYPKYLWNVKRRYFERQTQFIEEVRLGKTFTHDLDCANVEEFAISCRAASDRTAPRIYQ